MDVVPALGVTAFLGVMVWAEWPLTRSQWLLLALMAVICYMPLWLDFIKGTP